jgi:UDP-N-acetyl-D-mannosaminuronic acid dehydrogenase
MSNKRVCMVDLGHIALSTEAVMASRGFDVIGVDCNPEVVEAINAGQVRPSEPDLDTAVRTAVQSGKLKTQAEPEAADAFLIAVPTPFGGDGQPDLSHIQDACRVIAPHLERGNLVVLESTCPVGATDEFAFGCKIFLC